MILAMVQGRVLRVGTVGTTGSRFLRVYLNGHIRTKIYKHLKTKPLHTRIKPTPSMRQHRYKGQWSGKSAPHADSLSHLMNSPKTVTPPQKLKSQEAKLKDFCQKTNRRVDTFRVQVSGFDKSVSQKAVWAEKKAVANGGKSGIIEEKEIANRNMANGLRTSATHILTAEEITSIRADILAIGADETIFRFNAGRYTGYNDDGDFINIRGDVLPDGYSNHPRDKMSQRAVIAHEYYGHRANRNTTLPKGSWNDEFRASYMAAKNCPNLSDEDRRYLIMDALERAKEAGVSINYNDFIRRVLYGY